MISANTPGPLPRPPTGLSGVVLLVEDDDAVRTVTRRMLEIRGLTVLAADGPAEALRVSGSYPGRIDVLVTDVRMPGMDGPELAARVRAGRPNLKVVFMSGYTREEAFGPGPVDDRAEFLQKPFSPLQLADTLARLLRPAAGTDTVGPPSRTDDTDELPALGPDTAAHKRPKK